MRPASASQPVVEHLLPSASLAFDIGPVPACLPACPPGRFTASLVLFVFLMAFVLAEYRKLPYSPFR